jgi:phthalate 4,5-dioxygenase reductase component
MQQIVSITNPDAATTESLLAVRVTSKRALATGTVGFELVSLDGRALPAFTPGAHVTVVTPIGVRRNYSLCSDPHVLLHYEIAVKRDQRGRGGSMSMADDAHVGAHLSITQPRNNFELTSRATDLIFIAGGIGITPILSMMRHLKRLGAATFKLYYCTRDVESTAFLDVLNDEFRGHVMLHHDRGDINNAFDFWPVLQTPSRAHVYCCGPKGLMDSVADMSGHWPSGSIHFESFGTDAVAFAQNTDFSVCLQKSGRTMRVGKSQTLLEVLRTNGVSVRSSCESGTCGSCKTGLISGDVEHRDQVLFDDERTRFIMPCVSRARSGELVLDL